MVEGIRERKEKIERGFEKDLIVWWKRMRERREEELVKRETSKGKRDR